MPERIIAQICHAPTKEEAFQIFGLNRSQLEGYKIILPSEAKGVKSLMADRSIGEKVHIRGLIGSQFLIFLDADTHSALFESTDAQIPLDYTISLDTQAVSYFEPFINGVGNLGQDVREAFSYLIRDDVHIDSVPYVFENMANLGDSHANDRIYEKIKAFEIIKTVDKQHYRDTDGDIRSHLTDREIAEAAQAQMSKMLYSRTDARWVSSLDRQVGYMYILLLQMIYVQFSFCNKTNYQKTDWFLSFCHDELAAIFFLETQVAQKYFEVGQRLRFFGKIQKKSREKWKKGVFNILRGMAWDMLHLRNIERTGSINANKMSRYLLPSFLTVDQPLAQLFEFYQLRGFAFNEERADIVPIPKAPSPFQDFQSREDSRRLEEKFYSSAAVADRKQRRNTVEDNFHEIIGRLEPEVERLLVD